MSNTTYRVLVEKLGASNPEEFIGNEGELFYDPTGSSIRLSDGITPGGIVLGGTSAPQEWVRSTDWLAMPEVLSTEEKFVGLFAVYNTPENFIALQFEGDYTVNWGDGNIENVSSGVKAEHSYDWNDVSSSTLTSEGYRQVLVTVTPQSGQQLTTMDLNVVHSFLGINISITAPWLDVIISMPNADTGHSIASFYTSFSTNSLFYKLERVNILNCGGMTDMNNMFNTCLQLRSVSLPDTSLVTSMNAMFTNCVSLTTVPLFDTSSVTDMNDMFSYCSLLPTVPLFNTSSVTSMGSMFVSCISLTTVPLFNTSLVTNMGSMFDGCNSLTAVPLFNTSSVTSMSSMFANCGSLTTVPLFDTSSVTSMNSMFNNCGSLTTVPLFDTSSVTDMGDMFYYCASLITVPLFDTSSVTNMNNMFYYCFSLPTVPLFNTSSVTDMNFVVGFNPSLQIGAFDGTSVNISYEYCLLGRNAIVDIFNNLGTVVTATINVSHNYGAASLTAGDIQIATDKGWTVVTT